MKSEYHLFVLWEKARSQEEKILNDIHQHFSVVKLYEIIWSQEFVANNFTRFYGTNLPPNSEKEKHCGTGPFLLIIVKDENPVYEIRTTSHGSERVNINLFDAKTKYRLWTGGGHKVHATNNSIEFCHDLVLLLGINQSDFIKANPKYDPNIETIETDIVGAHGWDSLEKVFYVLNSTINYVILRGKEEILTGSFSDEHRDIDILIEDFQNAKYIINGVSSCSVARPHELIIINGYEYYLDLWVISRNYFDFRWARRMLNNRLLENGYYVLEKEDELYSLLYHTLVIKGKTAEDYRKKIERLKVNIINNSESNDTILVNFLHKNCFDITNPSDSSIRIHLENPIINDYAFRNGKLISTNYQDEKAQVPFFSVVYEKETSYYKRANDFLISNEVRFLKELENYKYFPKLLSTGVRDDGPYLETEKIQGESLASFFSSKKHLTISYIHSFIQQTMKILQILTEHGVIHRDFINRNLLVREEGDICIVSLIDFGWAIHKKDFYNCLNPSGLGGIYSPKDGCSDFYTFALTLKELWPNIHYVRNIYELMKTVIFEGQDDTKECNQILEKVNTLLNNKIDIFDRFLLFELRHKRFLIYRRKLTTLIKKTLGTLPYKATNI